MIDLNNGKIKCEDLMFNAIAFVHKKRGCNLEDIVSQGLEFLDLNVNNSNSTLHSKFCNYLGTEYVKGLICKNIENKYKYNNKFSISKILN